MPEAVGETDGDVGGLDAGVGLRGGGAAMLPPAATSTAGGAAMPAAGRSRGAAQPAERYAVPTCVAVVPLYRPVPSPRLVDSVNQA